MRKNSRVFTLVTISFSINLALHALTMRRNFRKHNFNAKFNKSSAVNAFKNDKDLIL